MGIITVKATAAIDSGLTAETVPSEFVLLKGGVNHYVDGELLFDADAALSVMASYQKRGLDLMADYEHQSLTFPPIIAPASAKKWTPELRNGDLVASNISWTPRAKQMIADGEYRYFSIACRVNEKTRRIQEVINFALTNNPAANSIAPLKAASYPVSLNGFSTMTTFFPNTEFNMSTVVVALGLSPDTDEASAVAKACRLVDLERDILALTSAKSLGEAMGALQALKTSHEQVTALTARVAEMEADKAKASIEKLVDAAVLDGRLTPANREGMLQLGAQYGVDAVIRSISMQTRVVATAAEQPKEATSGGIEITPMDIKLARMFCAGDEIATKKRLEALVEMRKNERATSL